MTTHGLLWSAFPRKDANSVCKQANFASVGPQGCERERPLTAGFSRVCVRCNGRRHSARAYATVAGGGCAGEPTRTGWETCCFCREFRGAALDQRGVVVLAASEVRVTAPAFSPLAWELALHGRLSVRPTGRRAAVTMSDGDVITGYGATSAEAIRALAVAVDAWRERTRVDEEVS